MTWSWDDVPGLDAETREIARRGRARYGGEPTGMVAAILALPALSHREVAARLGVAPATVADVREAQR